MKYCSYCGAPIEDDAKFCPSCGARCEGTDVYDSSSSKPTEKSSDNCKVFGILSVVFGALGGWLGLVFGIIGLCKDKEKKIHKTLCNRHLLICCWSYTFNCYNGS